MAKIICSICARAGSKGVKNKNTKDLLGKPLIQYTFDCIKKSKKVDDIVISTDCEKVIKISKENNISYVYRRDENLASDSASKWDVFKDLILKYEEETGEKVKYLVDLDITVPNRKSEYIDECISLLENNDSTEVVITGYEPERNPYFNMMEIDENNIARIVKKPKNIIACRQDAPIVYSLSPAVFAMKRESLFNLEHWSDAICQIHPISREFALDIDTELDFEIVECLMRSKNVNK